ncbi:N-acetyltransferase family protein [Brevibacillus porteri]|uniref:GNAT family N-acetyltransferase n=1 Tax=Brevibacillus porteri TaxID=2126350 RepID=UPI003D20BE98
MQIRNVQEQDYLKVITVLNDWWAGRQMSDMLPKLFFIHFQSTSFIVEENGEVIAFLIGFLSQTFPGEAYIHFVGVHPDKRKDGWGRELYHHFFQTVKQKGCDTIRCITSPVNKGSIAFHTKLGFAVEKGDKMVDGIAVTTNYDGKGNDRVTFVKKI